MQINAATLAFSSVDTAENEPSELSNAVVVREQTDGLVVVLPARPFLALSKCGRSTQDSPAS